jgi:hypothetical protein
MTTTAASIQAQIPTIRFNPAAIQRVVLSALSDVLDGTLDITDATNPFVFLLEASAITAAACMTENQVLDRKQYPSNALTVKDLYLHMSDKDYVGRFATPGLATISVILGKDELYTRVVPTGVGNISMLIIPRETNFTVNGYVFTMQYPIEVRVMGHGGLQIVYDNSAPSPLQALATNEVAWSVQNYNGTECVVIQIPVYQFAISPNYAALNNATGFSMTYGFNDQYVYARVYVATAAGTWQEIVTTYTDQVFDPLTPTAVLKVLTNQLQVDIPQIYLTTGQLSTELRIDIYTTKGAQDVSLTSYQAGQFTAQWLDLDSYVDPTEISPFVAPLTVFNTVAIIADSDLVGGNDALSFADLRTRVMANAVGAVSEPITAAQLSVDLQDLGYDSVLDVDNVTNRVYLATRQLPAPTDGSVSSGAGCAIMTLQSSMNALVAIDTVKDNGNRITLLPSTLYEINAGVVSPVPNQNVAALKSLAIDVLVNNVNAGNYVFTPFHYVLDINSNAFACRGYYIDSPTVLNRGFVAENDTLGVSVSTGLFSLVRTYANATTGDVDGFALYVTTSSEVNFQALADNQIVPQLSFIPEGEIDRAYLNGTLVSHVNADGSVNATGVERIYKFVLGTNYDFDASDNMNLNTFQMFDNSAANHFTPLTGAFELIYTVNGVTLAGQTNSTIDASVGPANLPANSVGITQEVFNIQFGNALNGFWERSRSIAGSQDYARYTANVPYVYANTVYARDPATGTIEITLNSDGSLSYVVLHNAGDPVLDPATGLPTIQYHVGDVIVDGQGNPVVVATRQMQRQVDLFFMDGNYFFATQQTALNYKASVPQLLISWLNTDIATVSQSLLEQTTLLLYPKTTLGSVQATVQAGSTVTLNAQLSFTVNFYLTGTAYRNLNLRQALITMASTTIAAALNSGTIATNDILDTMTELAGTDVVGIDLSGLGGAANYTTVTTADDSIRLSVGKKTVANADGTIGVVDAITVNFIQHSVN